uniref:NLE domain-containing protein n=1 Tax=Anopheles maculatus TaxID=74869 RepID=A0A182SXX5_9DIPT
MEVDETEPHQTTKTVQARFVSDVGEEAGPPLALPVNVTKEQLELICNALLKNEQSTPYLFFVNDEEIKQSIDQTVDQKRLNAEDVLDIVYQPQAVFRVRAVSRCTSTMPGHAEAVISLAFSPNSVHLASGSGDKTLRLWDLNTETPHHTCTGHRQWVMCVSWAPDSLKIASACKAGEIRIWSPDTGKQLGRPLVGHKKWISCLSWEPYHRNAECRFLASAGNDNDARIWDIVLGTCVKVIAGHTAPVTAVRWGGSGLLYTSSRDRTIKINKDALKQMALERYEKVCPDGVESFVSCSDDFTLYLWRANQKQFVTRMTGHQNVVNDVKYSPDVKLIASASFDKSIRLWRAGDGAFICALRGHVQAVYTVGWSADSRLVLSGSKDSTLKVWSVKERKLVQELPGHADEVYGVDWAPDGSRVASGGKDKVLKLWAY